MAETGEIILQVEQICKSFGAIHSNQQLSYSFQKGKIVGLLGPNGAGKTTLLRILTGILSPDTGTLLWKNQMIQNSDFFGIAPLIGYLPEERGLYKQMKAGEHILYLAQLKKLSKKEALVKAKYWFEKFHLMDRWDQTIASLSKGLQQKVQLIASLVHEPELLILDEPFTGLDPIHALELQNVLLELKTKGVCIVLSTHRMEQVEHLCDDLWMLHKGKEILKGSVLAIQEKYSSQKYHIEGIEEKVGLEAFFEFESFLPKSAQTNASWNAVIVPKDKTWSDHEALSIASQNAKIISFKKDIPSLSSIFVQAIA